MESAFLQTTPSMTGFPGAGCKALEFGSLEFAVCKA